MKKIILSDGWHLVIFATGEIHLCRTIDGCDFAIVLARTDLPDPFVLEGGINLVRSGGLSEIDPN